MTQITNSPLSKFKRAPKLYIDLPSKGLFWPKDVLEKAEEIPVYSMTANDEIHSRTPDALYTGQAVKSIIENCIPSIKDAWFIPAIDIDHILANIRLASYGDTITLENECQKCGEKNQYAVELQNVIDHLNSQVYQNEIQIEGFTIRIRPLTYKELTDVQKETIGLQRQIVQNFNDDPKSEKQEALNAIYKRINDIQLESVCSIVTEIITPDGDTETNPVFIKSFLLEGDKEIFNAIRNLQETNVKNWRMPHYQATCEACEEQNEIAINLDYSNFFVHR